MGTLTLKFKQKLADIWLGVVTTNLKIQFMWWGTSSVAESENHTDLQAPDADPRRLATLIERVNKQFVIGDFIAGADAVTLFGAGTILREAAIFWEPQTGGDMVARHVGTGLPITVASALDIRVDFTITNEQG